MARGQVTKDMLDPDTPPDVNVTAEAREPIWDPTVGVAVARPLATSQPKHRLVAIGDSLSHGFQSAAIFNTDLSYPAIIAAELGWASQFRYPTYDGFGGLPTNLEFLIRDLEGRFGERLDFWEIPSALFRTRHLLEEIEDWWERGPGSVVQRTTLINHNLAIYGWDLRDTLARNADICAAAIQAPRDQWLPSQVEHANEIAAIRVLAGARDATNRALTPLEAAAALGTEGGMKSDGSLDAAGDGIETLIVFLGANNALKTVTELRVSWTRDEDFQDLRAKEQHTVWRPTHFKKELDAVVAEVAKVRARHVIWATVPHVTIAPIARGVASKVRAESRYFPYYTRPWISDRDFDANHDPCITAAQARAVDSAIDQFNGFITDVVRDARKKKKDWYLFDAAGMLDRLATRRYIESPASRPPWWSRFELPVELRSLAPVPDTRFFGAGPDGRTQGGLFSLDGVHPTTIGYGLLAQELITIMQTAGVPFYRGDGRTERRGPVRVDFARLISRDSLIAHPPVSVTSDLKMIGWADERLDVFRTLLHKVPFAP